MWKDEPPRIQKGGRPRRLSICIPHLPGMGEPLGMLCFEKWATVGITKPGQMIVWNSAVSN